MECKTQNAVSEWVFCSRKDYADPFNNAELTGVFTLPNGTVERVPAFWAGGNVWKVRYSPPVVGRYTFNTECTDSSNFGLHGVKGEFETIAYTGDNPLYKHGRISVAPQKRHFQYSRGTPFFWLADTWWMGLCSRLEWPQDFQRLALDRLRKGFTVIQIVAGLYPDMPPFDSRGINEAGYPWEADFVTINPEYFNYADRRIDYLVSLGMSPCIVGCWGYYIRELGIEKMKKHWRYLVARYGAYPVFWCLAGEAKMPFYLSETKDEDVEFQIKGWTELAEYLRGIDPFKRPLTVHPGGGMEGRDQVEKPELLDFEMLQTGHDDLRSLPLTVETMRNAVTRQPAMPVINGEVCYEGIGEACRQEVQRLMFWASMLNGAGGHTYGANGIWQVNTREQPYGPSPHGLAWGNTPWDEAAQLPGSGQLGLSKRLMDRYEWWRMEAHPEWIDPHWNEADYLIAYAAGVSGEFRMIYWPRVFTVGTVKRLEPGVRYNAYLFNPVNGEETALGAAEGDENGDWIPPVGEGSWRVAPLYQDWVLVLDNGSA